MSAVLIDGKKIAGEINEEIKKEVEKLTAEGRRKPSLAVVLVGDDPASTIYVSRKEKSCITTGINSIVKKLSSDISEKELISILKKMNEDDNIDGILVQLPLPGHIDSDAVTNFISPSKDVDGFGVVNLGKLILNKPFLVPCTPAGILELLKRSGCDISGKNTVVLGRSNIVGKPVAMLMMHNNSTVTICHSKTRNIDEICGNADILIAAIGKANFVRTNMVKKGSYVIDVGINRVDGKLVGDVCFDEAVEKAAAITPVPGGVGPMTVAMLLKNTITAYRFNLGLIN